MITELRDFYYKKFTAYRKCRDPANKICHMLHSSYHAIKDQISSICTYISSLQCVAIPNKLPYIHMFIADLKNHGLSTNTALNDMDQIVNTILSKPHMPIDLTSFMDGPSSHEVCPLFLQTEHN
jgi:hypothetical protein